MGLLTNRVTKKSIVLLVLLALSLPLFSLSEWDMTESYVKGNEVIFNNIIWRAKWWSHNEVPGRFVNSAWEKVEELYDYSDNVAPSRVPPAGLQPEETPMFVILSSDDNFNPDGMHWVLDLLKDKKNSDGSPVNMTFYHPISSLWMQSITDSWIRAMDEGHEVANHTLDHAEGGLNFTLEHWLEQLSAANSRFIAQRPYGLGAYESQIKGFRAPFLAYNGELFKAMKQLNMQHDSTIIEGYHSTEDGTNFYWPYTLNEGSPAHDQKVSWGGQKAMTPTPGVWEVPMYALMTPDDAECIELGIAPGLKERCAANVSWYANSGYKMSTMDYNLIFQYKLTPEEQFAVLKYNFDKRVTGNRAPFVYGIHSTYYGDAIHQYALEKFVNYVLSHQDVRVVTAQEFVEWMRDPQPLAKSK